MKLSLCLAVYNEEKNIHYPLDSAIDLVDEVVIVDGGSTDKTLEIAQSYGKKVRIIKSDNPAMFHKNKQMAIEAAKGGWILQLDADEELSKGLKEEIKNVVFNKIDIRYSIFGISKKTNIQYSISNIVAFYIPRKNFFLTRFLKKGGQYPDYTIRLYRNGYARFPCQDIHENVEIIQNPKFKNQKNNSKFENLKIGYLKNPILHYAYTDFSRYLLRWDRYTSLEAQRLSNIQYPISNIKMFFMFFEYFFWRPMVNFFSMYIYHKGFIDGFPGFVFTLFSSLRFWVIYIKFWHKKISRLSK